MILGAVEEEETRRTCGRRDGGGKNLVGNNGLQEEKDRRERAGAGIETTGVRIERE